MQEDVTFFSYLEPRSQLATDDLPDQTEQHTAEVYGQRALPLHNGKGLIKAASRGGQISDTFSLHTRSLGHILLGESKCNPKDQINLYSFNIKTNLPNIRQTVLKNSRNSCHCSLDPGQNWWSGNKTTHNNQPKIQDL